MSAEKLVEKRLRHFWQQIRAQQIQKIFQYYRQNLVLAHISANIIPTLCFPKNNARPQIVSKVLNQYRQILISAFNYQMVDENSPNSQVSPQLHVNFWSQCLFWLDKNKPNNPNIVAQLKSFIFQLKQSFSWQLGNISQNLLDLYMELIQKLCFQFQDQLKKSLAEWISHIKYIPLIQKLITSTREFPSPNHYPNIYKIIKQALNSQTAQYQKSSAKFILQISRCANPTQNFLIFKYDTSIFSRLYQLLDQNSQSIQAINYWPPVFYLLKNYSQVIEYAVKRGLIGICCKLIHSNLEDNIFGALAILKVLSCGQNQVLSVMKNNLLQNEESWLSACLDRNIFNHMKVDISKLFFQIIKILIYWSNENQLIAFCSIFQNKRKSILSIICSVWQTSHKDEDTVNFTLQCVSALLIWNQILLFDQQSVQLFLRTNNMIPFISKCQMSENPKISDIAYYIIDQMDRIDKNKGKSFI